MKIGVSNSKTIVIESKELIKLLGLQANARVSAETRIDREGNSNFEGVRITWIESSIMDIEEK